MASILLNYITFTEPSTFRRFYHQEPHFQQIPQVIYHYDKQCFSISIKRKQPPKAGLTTSQKKDEHPALKVRTPRRPFFRSRGRRRRVSITVALMMYYVEFALRKHQSAVVAANKNTHHPRNNNRKHNKIMIFPVLLCMAGLLVFRHGVPPPL